MIWFRCGSAEDFDFVIRSLSLFDWDERERVRERQRESVCEMGKEGGRTKKD